jgi:hypothetical protein
MCGRFTLRTSAQRLSEAFGVEVEDLAPRYNIAPTQQVFALAVLDGQRHLFQPKWGLVPSWSKDDKSAAKLINARAETVAEKPSFRAALKRRRCLLAAAAVALIALVQFVWLHRARSARRWKAALDAYAVQEIARDRRGKAPPL